MSAITGIGDSATIVRSASTSLSRGTAQRIRSPPASATARIWRRVACTSAVSVFVIDWTTTGAPPPIGTPPTFIWRADATGVKGTKGSADAIWVSLESALSRIAALQQTFDPPQPQPTPTQAPADTSFASTLQSAMAPQPAQAARGSYAHLDGDTDASPELLSKLDALAAQKGMKFHITSGLRTIAEQQRLWDNRASNPFPVARPGTSRHQSGRAADVTIGGRPIQDVIGAAELRAAGLNPLAGDAVHVELP
jgi:D-alanyl-D-alanine carboxypeptidase